MDKIIDLIELKAEEEVLKIERQSLLSFIPKIIIFAVWFVVPFFFVFALFRMGLFGVFIFLALIGTALIYGFVVFRKWAFTAIILTDRRVVDIDQKGIFDRQISETPFDAIDEVSYRIKGIMPTILRFGAVKIQISGNSADIIFNRLRHPARVHNLINDLRKVFFDEDEDRKERKLKRMSKEMSVDELSDLAVKVREHDIEEAGKELFERRIID